MSRKILSYADMGPITSVTTPIPRPSSPHPLPSREKDKGSPRSPPRKRLRTNNDSDDILSSPKPSKDINNGTAVVVPQMDAERDEDLSMGANTRKRKKVQRPGNPSGVPWTLHWDAQHAQEEVSYDANGVVTTTTLAYDEEDATMVNASATTSTGINRNAASHNASHHRGGGGGGQPRPSVSHRHSNKWNGGSGGGGGMNGSTSKTMPPPPPSFIGPVIPSSSTEHRTAGAGAAITENLASSREPERNGRRKNRNGDGKGNNRRGFKTKEEAVSLVNEEEWDDSTLIDAWNAAEEEYREMNGGKKWRCEPVKHSSLWHDEFHEDTDEEPSDNDNADDDDNDDDALQDSLGVIEETFVEQSYEVYDKRGLGRAHAHASTSSTQVLFGQASSSSGMPSPHPDASALFGNLPAPVPLGTTRSSIMEEAFRRAQEASYTAGYWTAVYQMHASQKDLIPSPPPAQSPVEKLNGSGVVKRVDDSALVGDVVEEEEGEIEEEEHWLPTQR